MYYLTKQTKKTQFKTKKKIKTATNCGLVEHNVTNGTANLHLFVKNMSFTSKIKKKKQKKLLGAAIERKPKIENVNLAGGKLIREAKVNDEIT